MRSSRLRRLGRLTALTAVLATGLAACGSGSDSGGAANRIRLVEYPSSAVSWLAYVAEEKGYFTANNVDVTLTQLPAGQQGTAALVGKSVDIAILDTNNLAPLLSKGQKFTLLSNAVTNYWVLVGEKSASGRTLEAEMKALQGKAVNAPSIAGTGAKQLQALATAYRLDKSKINVVADPTNAALTAGKVQASMTDVIGSCRLTAAGYPQMMNFVDPPQDASSYPSGVQSLIGLAGLGYWSAGDWSNKHAAAVTGFQKAIQQAADWATSASNLDAFATLIRASKKYNLTVLNDAQWTSCVKQVAATYRTVFTAKDTQIWGQLVKQEGLADSLPPASEWQAKGLLTTAS